MSLSVCYDDSLGVGGDFDKWAMHMNRKLTERTE